MKSKHANVSGRRSEPRAAWLDAVALRDGGRAKYLAIAEALAAAIEAGEIAPGERLPPQRRIAAELEVDLTTVTRAYAHARAMGLLDGEVGRGTFVRGSARAEAPVVDLSMNLPPPADAALRALMQRAFAGALQRGDPAALMSYRTGLGGRRDRAAAAVWLSPRLGRIELEHLFVAPGAQSALIALLALLARTNRAVLVEGLTYPGFLNAARLLGVRMQAIACDSGGLDPEALERACRTHKPAAVYLTPTLQNPTTRTLSERRRRAIARIARAYDVAVIEDDAYGALAPEHAPLARFAPERVFHVSTLSKCLTPGLRTAFVVAPEAWAARVGDALRAAALMPTPFLSDIATHWIETGEARRLSAHVVKESAARMALARAILPARAEGGPAGFHLWMTSPPGWRLGAYVAAARAQGAVTVGAELFAADPAQHEAGVRIALGAAPDRIQLEKALRALAALESVGPETKLVI